MILPRNKLDNFWCAAFLWSVTNKKKKEDKDSWMLSLEIIHMQEWRNQVNPQEKENIACKELDILHMNVNMNMNMNMDMDIWVYDEIPSPVNTYFKLWQTHI